MQKADQAYGEKKAQPKMVLVFLLLRVLLPTTAPTTALAADAIEYCYNEYQRHKRHRQYINVLVDEEIHLCAVTVQHREVLCMYS